jgi:hypothetical protein
MTSDWQELTRLTGGQSFVVERVRLKGSGIAIEGRFDPPSLVSLSAQDQVFVAAFVRCHGSIKRMEEMFGISYPTVKNRLNRISEGLEFVEVDAAPSKADVLAALEEGELSVDEAVRRLRP